MVMMQSSLLIAMMFMAVGNECAQLFTKTKSKKGEIESFRYSRPEDLHEVFRFLQFNLSSVLNFGLTCQTYHTYCALEQICQLPSNTPYLKPILDNYHYCTCALSYLATKDCNHIKNKTERKETKKLIKKSFDRIWDVHKILRDEEIKDLRGNKKVWENVSNIKLYCHHYHTPQHIKERERLQITKEVHNQNSTPLYTIMSLDSYDLGAFFPGEWKVAIKNLCQIAIKDKNSTILVKFIKRRVGDDKRKVFECIFQRDTINDWLACEVYKCGFMGKDDVCFDGFTPLHCAVWYNLITFIQLLWDDGVRLNTTDNKGHIALYYARNNQQTKALLWSFYTPKGVQYIAEFYINKWKPLQEAQDSHAKKNDAPQTEDIVLSVVKSLCQRAIQNGNITPLTELCMDLKEKKTAKKKVMECIFYNTNEWLVSELFKAKIIENGDIFFDGFNVLSLAAWYGFCNFAQLLINSGADVHQKSNAGHPPVCYAVKKNQKKAQDFLWTHYTVTQMQELAQCYMDRCATTK